MVVTMNQALHTLYEGLQKRPRPEDVAELCLEALQGQLNPTEERALHKAAESSFKRWAYTWSSMAQEFLQPVSAEKQVNTASKLFSRPTLTATEAMDPVRVQAYVEQLSAQLGGILSKRKLKKAERHAIGIYKNQGWYNKRRRYLLHLEDKCRRLAWESRKYLFTRVGKSALAIRVPQADFEADANTACLTAYMAARMSRRSIFTNESQDRAFDKAADALLARCEASTTTRWDVLAHVMPDKRVLSHLAQEQIGGLIGTWWTILTDMAAMLGQVQSKYQFNLETMIVHRGQDSSTWNEVGGGWNQARSHWVSLLHAAGLGSVLDAVCPGKVMRLMAADVARWHQASGGAVHPDTAVWARLPKPWEVVSGTAACGRKLVEKVCRQSTVEPEGWVGAKVRGAVETKPTPELVHGVAVSAPGLALILRKAGAFSGQPLTREIPEGTLVHRDEHGAAVMVTEA